MVFRVQPDGVYEIVERPPPEPPAEFVSEQ